LQTDKIKKNNDVEEEVEYNIIITYTTAFKTAHTFAGQ
jgi:hypothetical protein